jgi:hypothetical protein
MESILNNRRPVAVTFTDEDVIVTLSDGTKVSNPLSWHWWLEQATPEQRANVEYYSDSVDWPDLDEGLDIEGMLRGIKPKQPRSVT